MKVFISVWSVYSYTRQLKEDNGKKLKQNAERYGVREGSPVEENKVK